MKIAIFSTSERRGREKTLTIIKSLIPNADIVGELGIAKTIENREEIERKIIAWCNKLKSA